MNEVSVVRVSSPGTWHGHEDSATSPSCFFYHEHGAVDHHREQFAAVKAKIEELTRTRDGNGDWQAQLIYTREDDYVHVVAFRFTSDYANRVSSSELTGIGSSLGRGQFAPFRSKGDFEMFCANGERPRPAKITPEIARAFPGRPLGG